MVRRPLVATIVTTAIGALFGALLGALVGRVIAFFGDETVQVSVPMVFCGTLGFFVGGASAAKGSLDRFGARRSGLGAFVAIVVLVLVAGGASVSHQSGIVLFAAGIVATALAGAAATLVAGAQPAPVARGGLPQKIAPPREAEGALQEPEVEHVSDPAPPAPVAPAARPPIRKVPVAEPEPEPGAELEPEAEPDAEPANWTLPEASSEPEPEPEPANAPARPRRDRPLRREDVAAAATKTAKATKAAKAPVKAKAAKVKAPEITPPPAPRQRRDRPLRKGDS